MLCSPRPLAVFLLCLLALPLLSRAATPADDAKIVGALDDEYQAAVERNDAVTMDRILTDDFVLVLGDGATHGKAKLLENARTKKFVYELQRIEPGTQKVRVSGDTAVVTALLAIKGTREGKDAFEFRLWYSDTYVRTPTGWRYFFGQASLPLPKR